MRRATTRTPSGTFRRVLSAAAAAAVFVAPAFAEGELFVFGSYSAGEYVADETSETQSTVLQYAGGDRFQYRLETRLLRIRSGSVILRPGLGPTPGGPGHGPGPAGGWTGQSGSGGQPGSGSGSASGSGSGEPDLPPDETAGGDWITGLGDLRLGAFARLLGGGARVYRMDTGLEIKMPTADESEGLGTGEMDYRLSLSGQYRFWTHTAFGAIGWNALGDPSWTELRDGLDGIAGIESEPLKERWVLSGWLEGNQEFVPGAGARSALGAGLRTTGRCGFHAVVIAGLGGSAEDYSVALGLSLGTERPFTGVRGTLQ